MANTKDTTPETVEATEAPKTRGRKATRDPNGKSLSGYFTEGELKKISEARFVGRHEQVNDLVRVAVNEYVDRILATEK